MAGEVTRELDCVGDIRSIWWVITDTERMGRALGYDRIEARPIEDGAGASRYVIRTRVAGIELEYEEEPFEWVEPERFSSRRICRKGPFKRIETTWQLALRPGGGTHVTLRVLLEPTARLLAPLVRASANRAATNMIREVQAVDERLRRGEDPFALRAVRKVAAAAFERAAAALREAATPAEREVAARLVDYVRSAPDPDVSRMRPFELAARWGADRRAAVGVCLKAVSAGLLELTWDIVCPSCRTATDRLAALSDLGEQGHCPLCDLSFGVDLDRAIEATFHPAPAVRVVEDAPRCIGGPARTPHVIAQVVLSDGATATIPAPGEAGRYRLFLRGGATASVEVAEGGAAEAELAASDRLEPAHLTVRPGAAVRVRRQGPPTHVKLERVEWASLAATAHFVSTLPTFRRQFAGDVLRPGVTLKVSRAALLFSDLTASTALYHRAGDAVAFKLVQDHFDLLSGILDAHAGVLVKTIGDAVMAAFLDDADAVRAAVAMQRAWPEFRARHASDAPDVFLKVGVHAGPCYVVTANRILDYFGQSVNIAARLQGLAGAGEIVLSEELAAAAEAGGWLAGAAIAERFTTPLKGLDEPVRAVRVRGLTGVARAAAGA